MCLPEILNKLYDWFQLREQAKLAKTGRITWRSDLFWTQYSEFFRLQFCSLFYYLGGIWALQTHLRLSFRISFRTLFPFYSSSLPPPHVLLPNSVSVEISRCCSTRHRIADSFPTRTASFSTAQRARIERVSECACVDDDDDDELRGLGYKSDHASLHRFSWIPV